MTVFFTILAGVSTLVVGQILLKLIVDPIHEFKKMKSHVAYNLSRYANVYGNPRGPYNQEQTDMSLTMRDLSSALREKMDLIPSYDIVRLLFGLPERKQVIEAHRELIALSNGCDGPLENQGILNLYSAQHVRYALDLHIPEGERLNPELERQFIKAKEPPWLRDFIK